MSSLSDLRLVVRSGPLSGRTLDLPATSLSLGRDGTCDVKLDDPKVSRIHGFIEIRGDDVFYRDNKSTNGSLVNGRKVTQERLRPGDVLQLGSSEFALLEHSDFQSINFVADQTMVTRAVTTESVSVDALAKKFGAVLEFYRENRPNISDHERVELAKAQRLIGGLNALFTVSQRMAQILPMEELLEVVATGLFEVFSSAENLVILLRDDKRGTLVPKFLTDRNGNGNPNISISTTVLNQAVEARSTLVANDVGHDARFSASESIVGFSVKAVVCAPLVVGAGKVLGALYLDNREQRVTYDELDTELVTAFANQAAIAIDNARLCDDLQDSYTQTLQSLVKAIEAKDTYTMGHTQRVKEYTLGIAQYMGLPKAHIERIGMAADLHDIGKIGIKEGIINKPGSLTDTEYHSIKMHVEMGEMILRPITYLQELLPWIRGHHEKWDGTGYPDGLKGEECPLEARIIALADAFDAMTSQRPYNKPLTFDQAVARVKEASGRHFDPRIVAAFERYMAEIVLPKHRAHSETQERERTPTPAGAAVAGAENRGGTAPVTNA